MTQFWSPPGLETKFARFGDGLTPDTEGEIRGYASVFGRRDQGGDIVAPGAYGAALARLRAEGRQVKMLWQHDATQPIGVWDEVREDERGLFVRGRILAAVARGAEALALIGAGALDGLSIGYRTLRASRDASGARVLDEVELWEVSLVTFPMLPDARLRAPQAVPESDPLVRALAEALIEAAAD